MPRYFFDLYDDLAVHDDEGQELNDDQNASDAAVRSARQIAATQVLNGHLNLAHRIEARSEDGGFVKIVRFGEVIAITERAGGL
jgi:hypothetical protein